MSESDSMGFEKPNFGVEISEDISFPEKPAVETTPDGKTTYNRIGSEPGFSERMFFVSGRQLQKVFRLLDNKQITEAQAALAALDEHFLAEREDRHGD